MLKNCNDIEELGKSGYIFSTSFQQKMLKSALLIFITLFVFSSCTTFWQKKIDRISEVKVGMTEEEVKKILGEPTNVSKTSEGNILWTYRPSWKLIPDNRGTIILEFRDKKVIKVLKR